MKWVLIRGDLLGGTGGSEVPRTRRMSGGLDRPRPEQYADNRIIRPDSEYIGPRDHQYIPMEERDREAAS